jgi:hypothetical protein
MAPERVVFRASECSTFLTKHRVSEVLPAFSSVTASNHGKCDASRAVEMDIHSCKERHAQSLWEPQKRLLHDVKSLAGLSAFIT